MSRLLRAGAVMGPPPNHQAAAPAAPAERSPRAPRVSPGDSTTTAAGGEAVARRGWQFQDLPSGLASLAFHFAVLIVLGLLYTDANKPHLTEVIVDWQQGADELAGGGGGTDGTEDIEEPAELDSEWTSAAQELAAALPDSAPLLAESPIASEWGAVEADMPTTGSSDALADLAAVGEVGLRGIGTGGGSGGGEGKGHGDGIGDGTGPGSATGVFGLRDEGRRIVYVFDRSESMNSKFTLNSEGRSRSVTSLEAAKNELIKSVNELADGGEFQMIFYNDEPLPFPDHYTADGLSRADARTKEFAQQFVYNLIAERNTNHIDALLMATKLKPDVIFLLTDGEEKDDPSSGQVRRLQGICRRNGTRINVIHFCYEERPNSSLVALAKRTGGQFKAIRIRSLIDPNW